MAMAKVLSADVVCSNCHAVWEVQYCITRRQPDSQHPIGCPECQSTRDVPALMEQLERKAGSRYPNVVALVKDVEIGLGAELTPVTEVVAHHA